MALGASAKRIAQKTLLSNSKHGKHIGNAFSGKKVAGWVAPAILGGAVLAGGGLGNESSKLPYKTEDFSLLDTLAVANRNNRAVNGYEVVESAAMQADGLSTINSQADDLGTNGSMVFGMHNSRKGGYI